MARPIGDSASTPIGKPEATTRSIGLMKSYGNGSKRRRRHHSTAYSTGNGKSPSDRRSRQTIQRIAGFVWSTQLLRCIACLDPRNSFANYDEDKLIELAKIYADDFSEYDCLVLRDQLDTFISNVRSDLDFSSCSDLGKLAAKMVQTDRHTVFPLVYRLIELALILPVATATVERAFSAMNVIKTELRNKMNDEWMNHCMICYIERDVFTSIEDHQIIEHYHALRTRKHKLPRDLASGSLPSVDEE
uniref:HAT family dimerisation domain containing protein n=1 Tax=Oryza sativa subsp. japonica TaxID=39947 RepID=Q2R1H1_ORYSJ|nr:hAT family dimerisation domain containing protein [Oryza sativa Japonica Group]